MDELALMLDHFVITLKQLLDFRRLMYQQIFSLLYCRQSSNICWRLILIESHDRALYIDKFVEDFDLELLDDVFLLARWHLIVPVEEDWLQLIFDFHS